MLTLYGRTVLDYLSPYHYPVRSHMFNLSCESATTEPANARKSKVHRAGHVECGYFVSKMWRTLAKCSVGCYCLHGCMTCICSLQVKASRTYLARATLVYRIRCHLS
jgi:hypothetical protein